MIDPIANLEKLIKEMIVSQELLPRSPVERLIYHEEYVQGVLGISISLNESYPYSIELQERILQEQLLFEGFFSDFKKLGGDTKNLALAMRYMMEDGSRIKDFVSTAYETVIKDPLETFFGQLMVFNKVPPFEYICISLTVNKIIPLYIISHLINNKVLANYFTGFRVVWIITFRGFIKRNTFSY